MNTAALPLLNRKGNRKDVCEAAALCDVKNYMLKNWENTRNTGDGSVC